VTDIRVALVAACVLSACSNPAVSKAIGTGTDGDTPIVVRMSESAVTVENHAGRTLLNVRITIAADGAKSFALVVPTIDPGGVSEAALTGFRSDDGTVLDPAAVQPTQVSITARDTLAKAYEMTMPWKR
jgi:hypothetical protein